MSVSFRPSPETPPEAINELVGEKDTTGVIRRCMDCVSAFFIKKMYSEDRVADILYGKIYPHKKLRASYLRRFDEGHIKKLHYIMGCEYRIGGRFSPESGIYDIFKQAAAQEKFCGHTEKMNLLFKTFRVQNGENLPSTIFKGVFK